MRTRSLLGLTLASLLAFGAACGDKDDTGSTGDGGSDDTGAAVDCEDGICIVSGTITEDQTWTADNAYLLRGGVFIGDESGTTVLSIEPGTTIYGESSTDGFLVVTRNSRIEAVGTAEAPIVFTSSKSEGSRAQGDWGGLIINGNAPINACADPEADLCEAYGEGGTGWYGGSDAADSSGTLKYVRVEFAGTLISPDNELNGIAFQGVGSGTTVDYIQVHQNADDGVEFFGGTTQASHVLITGVGDDSFDWTDGWQGKLQYGIAEQYETGGDNGIEADNNGEDNEAEPYSAPQIANLTLIGSPDSADSDIGILLREGTKGDLLNVLVVDFNDSCVDIDNDVTLANGDAGELTLGYATIDCATSFADDEDSAADWFAAGEGNAEGTVSLSGYAPSSTIAGGDPSAWDGFFEAATYQGAIDGTDWTTGWTTSAAN